MTSRKPEEITGLLKAWVNGDTDAQAHLIPLVYNELRRLARHYRRNAGAGNTVQTTALVHEAYLRLVKIDNVSWHDRVHFFAVAAQLMRRILVDIARADQAHKRGGGSVRVEHLDVDEIPTADSAGGADLIALDAALSRLADLDPRRARVIELHVFAGLTHEEAAEILQVSPQSIKRDWRLGKAWLMRELTSEA
jgi:RNA polymerase sigma factor (TIGR02999 family)